MVFCYGGPSRQILTSDIIDDDQRSSGSCSLSQQFCLSRRLIYWWISLSLSRSRLSLHSEEGMYFTFTILHSFLFLFPSMALTPRIWAYWSPSQTSRMFTKFSELWLGSTPECVRGRGDLWNLRPAFRHHTAVLLRGLPETHETTCKLMDWPRSQGHVYANIWNSLSVTIFYKILHLFRGRGKVQPWPKSDFPLPNIEATEHKQYLIK